MSDYADTLEHHVSMHVQGLRGSLDALHVIIGTPEGYRSVQREWRALERARRSLFQLLLSLEGIETEAAE